MNHYQRLKVSFDAPPEVIRAAYRALANRLHPDRQGGGGEPLGESHEQMVALNMAYEVLIDPELRREYDASLSISGEGQDEGVQALRASRMEASGAGLDLESFAATSGASAMGFGGLPVAKSPSHQSIIKGVAALLAVLVVAAAVGVWRKSRDEQPLEQALMSSVNRGASQGDVAGADNESTSAQSEASTSGEAAHKPTVEELSRLSDDELLKALPKLDAAASGGTAGGAGAARRLVARTRSERPVLDGGTPLGLRMEAHLSAPLSDASQDQAASH